jgi:dCTP deaminase
MILPAQHIRARCFFDNELHPMIDPFSERSKQGGFSYGLSSAGYDVRCKQDIYLGPQGFALASIIEYLQIPNDILAIVHDKSSWGRLGLAVQNTVIEPGWRGYLTIELSNHSDKAIRIHAGMGIAQIIFHQLAAPTCQPYEGKYQDQADRPVEAIFESES